MTKSFWINLMRKPLGGLAGLIVLLSLAACGGGGTGGTSPQTPIAPLTISPGTITFEPGAPAAQLLISGGVKPYTLSSSQPNLIAVPGIISGDQDGRISIQPAFVPDQTASVVITVRDALQAAITAAITVNANPVVPPPALSVSPTSADTGPGVPVTFIITGGVGPYSVSSSQPAIVPNPIAVDAQGRFTVTAITNPSVNTTVTLTVRDSRSTTVIATLNVRSLPLVVSPTTATTTQGVPVTFQVSGGNTPYTVTSSSPSIIPNPTIDVNGRFTVTPLTNPSVATIVTLTVRDASGNQSTATVSITPVALTISPTAIRVAANTPVTFTITGGVGPYTVVSSQPNLVPNPTSIDSAGRFTLRATTIPTGPTDVLITVRDAAQNVVTATMTVLPATPIPLSVLPQTVIVYQNAPASLTIFGGTPPYQAFSSNPSVLPVTRNVVGDQIILAPTNVAADTVVTITVTDAAGGSATATVTVKPAPLLNTLTVTPTPATPGVGCVPAVCAGQTASVSVRVRNLTGAGIAGRSVRFENVQGNYQFFTNGPGLPDTFANSITVTTDQDGMAIVRIKADVNAPTQVALIRATELTTGNVVNSSFTIAQFTDGTGTLTAIPQTWTVKGPTSTSCAANTPVTYYIFGGTPPYRIQTTLPNFATIVPSIVQTNGGGFTAILTGLVCSGPPGTAITITDATGRTISVQLINDFGTGNPVTNFDAIQIVPGDILAPTLGCGASVSEQILGGNSRLADGSIQQAVFTVSSPTPGITAVLAGRNITVTRTTGPTSSPAIIYVSNGFSLVTFRVAVDTSTTGACAPPATGTGGGGAGNTSLTFSANPIGIACAVGSSQAVTVTGGTGTLQAPTSPTGITVTLVGTNTLQIMRTAAVLPGSSSIAVAVQDSAGTSSGILQVAPTGTCI